MLDYKGILFKVKETERELNIIEKDLCRQKLEFCKFIIKDDFEEFVSKLILHFDIYYPYNLYYECSESFEELYYLFKFLDELKNIKIDCRNGITFHYNNGDSFLKFTSTEKLIEFAKTHKVKIDD